MAVDATSNIKTIQDIIDTTSKTTSDRKVGELGKDDFINLLITQLKYQDPLKPMDDKEFIGQMAQFSALEQMQNMNSGFATSKAFSLIGKEIKGVIKDLVTNDSIAVEGIVESAKIENGKTYVIVDGKKVGVDQISEVKEPAPLNNSVNTNIATYTNLIGFNVTGSVYDGDTQSIAIVNGDVREIQKGLDENYAIMDNVKLDVSSIESSSYLVDSDAINEYLNNNIEKEISVKVSDYKGDTTIPITGKLKEYNISSEGKVSVTLDNLKVSVDSIIKIKKQ